MNQITDTIPSPVLPPPPLEIVIRGRESEDPVAYACPTCGMLFVVPGKQPELREEKMSEASTHCVKHCICGKPLDYHYHLRCKDCRAQMEKDKEKARFAKAERVSIENYEGPVYWEGHAGGLGDGYFGGIDEVIDYCEDDGHTVPEYVWACTPHPFTLSGEALIERELEQQEMYEDAGEGIPDDARQRLQAYLDVWCKEQNITGWQYDYTRAVILRDASPSSPP